MTEDEAFGVVVSFARSLVTTHKLSLPAVARILRRCADAIEAAAT